jgi:predicted secreted protein
MSLLLGWFAILVVGCASQPDVIATDEDNGGHVEVRSGQLFDIVLADDYDQTGCQWREDHSSGAGIVEHVGQRYEWGREPPAGTGNGTNTMRYRAQQTGTVRISLVESDNADRVCRRFAVDVSVGPASFSGAITSAGRRILPYVAGTAVVVVVLGAVGRLAYLLFRHVRD